jgi:hypothetical protein
MFWALARYPPPFGPKRAERDQFETHDFYVAAPGLEAVGWISRRGRLACEITNAFFAASMVTPRLT